MTARCDPDADPISTSKALVVVSKRDGGCPATIFVSDAGFLTQLISCKAAIGSYRLRRREEPGIASKLYDGGNSRGTMSGASASRTIKLV
jgi:hypothetical protein